ncbi:MAG: sulfotransferase family protein [Gaiellaceae bacterium]
MTRRPDTFIVGAPKSGTTSLYEYLEGHPDVFMSPVKEPFYFSPDVVSGRPRFTFGEDESEYLSLFANARQEKRAGEASVRYIFSREAPRLIREFQPDARIVAILRNPIDILYAGHNERVSIGTESLLDFEEALSADAERLEGRRLRPGSNALWATYRPTARHGDNLANWLSIFPRHQMHVIIFDDFAADTPGAFRRLLEFLEVDPDYRPASFSARRQSHRPRGGMVRALIRNPAARLVSHSVLPRLLGRSTASRIVWRFRQSPINRGRYERPPLAPELRSRLIEEFRPDVTRLSELLGRDLVDLWLGDGEQAPVHAIEEPSAAALPLGPTA